MGTWAGSELAKCDGLRIGQNYTCRTRTIRKNLVRQAELEKGVQHGSNAARRK